MPRRFQPPSTFANRHVWPGPLIVKGVLRAEDAAKAVEQGADGIVVSNHGGRALDSAAPTVDVLPEIVAVLGDRTTVLLDSGIRRGSDMVKALALGAKAVMSGRATLYGASAGGQDGAQKALAILAKEFEKVMAYVGCRTVDEVTPDIFAMSTALEWLAAQKRMTGTKEAAAWSLLAE